MKPENEVVVSNIQRMCMSDGPGIRTTVFLKGCNLHCPWCANPENINYEIETYLAPDGEEGIYGKTFTSEELMEEVLKDRFYWKKSGGITFSGGEPITQLGQIVTCLRELKKQNIHIAVETALLTESSLVKDILPYIDLFIVDIKLLDEIQCREIVGGKLERFFQNLEVLKTATKEILFRVPCNKEYTLKKENVERLKQLLRGMRYPSVEIFATHNLGKIKYESLKRKWNDFEAVKATELEALQRELELCGAQVDIISI